MAKEMMIIFVYDVEMVQREEDDPATAILYFHPGWVSDQQKVALCGQLMGTARCIKWMLATPNIISLQCGRFYLKEYGRYILAVGTDRNITDWLLEHRAKTIISTISFFHNGIENMAELYNPTGKMNVKLYQFFETYLKYFFLGSNLFCHVTTMTLPKSADGVFMESIQFLQNCRDYKHVLGGVLLFHNKVVASQLNPDITKRILLTDPHRIKSSAETALVDFELPVGVQLIQVYISREDYEQLVNTQKDTSHLPGNRDESLKSVPESTESSQANKPKLTRPNTLNLKKTTTSHLRPKIPQKQVKEKARRVPDGAASLPNLRPLNLSNLNDSKKSASVFDVRETHTSISKSITMKYYKLHENPSTKTAQDIHSVTDPCYPIFREDGTLVSQTLYQYLTNQNEALSKSQQCAKFDPGIRKNGTKITSEMAGMNGKLNNERRKSLSLPLKPLNDETNQRRQSIGVVLTPLMSKLSMHDDKIQTPAKPQEFRSVQSMENVKSPCDTRKCLLFVCGIGDAVAAILFDEGIGEETILKLWNICMESLGKLEYSLQQCLDVCSSVNSTSSDTESYSYLYLNPEWDTTKRGGLWGSVELGSLIYFHRDFKKNPNMSEILTRYHDGVIYGSQCDGAEVFFHQSAESSAGIPTVHDLMAQTPSKAKKRLEKDHSITVFSANM